AHRRPTGIPRCAAKEGVSSDAEQLACRSQAHANDRGYRRQHHWTDLGAVTCPWADLPDCTRQIPLADEAPPLGPHFVAAEARGAHAAYQRPEGAQHTNSPLAGSPLRSSQGLPYRPRMNRRRFLVASTASVLAIPLAAHAQVPSTTQERLDQLVSLTWQLVPFA